MLLCLVVFGRLPGSLGQRKARAHPALGRTEWQERLPTGAGCLSQRTVSPAGLGFYSRRPPWPGSPPNNRQERVKNAKQAAEAQEMKRKHMQVLRCAALRCAVLRRC